MARCEYCDVEPVVEGEVEGELWRPRPWLRLSAVGARRPPALARSSASDKPAPRSRSPQGGGAGAVGLRSVADTVDAPIMISVPSGSDARSVWRLTEAEYEAGLPRAQPHPKTVDAPDGLRRTAMQRLASWADPAARPSPGCFCSCCHGPGGGAILAVGVAGIVIHRTTWPRVQ
jgi:hypothetical protein